MILGERPGDDAPYTLTLPAGPAGPIWSPQDAGGGLPCVILAERAGFDEFAVVQRGLRALGIPSVRIMTGSVTRIGGRIGDPTLTVDGRRVLPTVTWVRHASARSMIERGRPALSMFRADSWCALTGQLSSLSKAWLPGGTEPGRLVQLRDAARLGIRVPRTVVTTDPGEAAAGLGSGRIVVKPIDHHFVEVEPGVMVGVFPEVVAAPAARRLAPGDIPVIVQEYVDHQTEFRVYFVAGKVVAFRVEKPSPAALWRDARSVTVAPAHVPEPVELAVRRLAGLWNLRYGAFDFLQTPEGPVFLEVNADGDWRWFESRAGVDDVTFAVLTMIRSIHDGVTGAAGRAIDLVGFLRLGTG